MRNELKNFKWHIHGLSERDLDDALRLTKDLIEAKKKDLKAYEEKTREENSESADDILDDIFYYSWVDMQILWQFCLWRLQSIFEGILIGELLTEEEARGLLGLKSKMDKVISKGYEIEQENYDELIEWGKLRNALSHSPPEHYRPIKLEESDVIEYLELLKSVTGDLKAQKDKVE